MDLFMVLQLLCGLALFLFGMNSMGDGLESLSGGKLEKTLEKMTNSTMKGFILGMAVTAVIQSSSATTVMVVGFVNSGIMKLRQAIGIIMGANVGTTITSWILSLSGIEGDSLVMQLLKPSSFSAVFAFVGIILLMFCNSEKKKHLGTIFLGFGILMVGMDQMSAAVEPLSDDPTFTGFLTLFNNPVFGILAGALLTAIIQSSSASDGILQALSKTGTISYSMAIPIVMGQNIGTCVTALISCIGAKKNAKRAAFVHLYFNIIGTLVICALFYGSNLFINYGFLNDIVGPENIAVVHTSFNLLATAILLPFNKYLEKLACLTIRDKDEDSDVPFLDERFLNTPSVATERAKSLAEKMARLSEGTLLGALELVDHYDEKVAETIHENEDMIDSYEDVISTYLVKLSSKQPSADDNKTIQLILHTIGDFERISDHAVSIVKVAQEIHEKNISFSKEAKAGLIMTLHLPQRLNRLNRLSTVCVTSLKTPMLSVLLTVPVQSNSVLYSLTLSQILREFPTIAQTLQSVLLKSIATATTHTNISTNSKIPMIFSTTQITRLTSRSTHFQRKLCLYERFP